MNPRIITEIERILNVVDETIGDLVILQNIPVFVSNFPEDIIEQMQPTTRDTLEKLYKQERQLQQRVSQKHPEVQALSDEVKSTVRILIHQLKTDNVYPEFEKYIKATLAEKQQKESDIDEDYQRAAHTLKSALTTKDYKMLPSSTDESRTGLGSDTVYRFTELMKEYRSVLEDKLNTTVEEEDSRTETRNETTSREKKATADVKALTRELTSEKSIRDREMTLRDQLVRKLRSEMEILQNREREDQEQFETNLAERERKKNQDFHRMETYLSTQIQNITAALEEKREENRDLESKMRVLRKNSETKVGSIVQKYDEFMTETTEKLKQLREDFKVDSDRVDFLSSSLDEFAKIKKQRETSDANQAEQLRTNIITIQSFVNSKILAMRALASYKKKMAAGKKKKRRK